MHTLKDLKRLVDMIEKEQQELIEIGCEQKKEKGKPEEDTCRRYNYLMCIVDRICIYLERDLGIKK